MENKCGLSRMSKRCKPPYWAMFNADCAIHDENYTIGGTSEDRLKYDLGYFRRILEDCNHLTDYNKKRKAVRVAITYYILIRIFGWMGFNFKR